MTDHELEQRLRSWYRAEIPASETAPADLRSSLRAIPLATPETWRRGAIRGRGVTLLAAAALVGLLAATAIVGAKLLNPPPPPAPTATAAAWTPTGSMANVHVNHTATLLPDGRVLVVGGYDTDGAPASAELYDPSTGTFTATGDMTRGRGEHTATLLPDGRVLVAGGGDSGTARTNTAELYDPGTGTWTATGDMNEARSGHTATLLPDGQVLVAGSGGVDGVADATAELYDPQTGTWTATANMVNRHNYHATVPLPDGTVLVAGGSSAPTSAELYDHRTGTWTATGPMVVGRWDAIATLLPNGTVLVTGEAESATSADLYDPRTGTWTATAPMIHARFSRHTATLMSDGTVLVVGGSTRNIGGTGVQELVFAELFDPRAGTWTATADMGVARRSHSATLLPDGRVLVAGGIPDDAYRSAELYHPESLPSVVPPSLNPTAEPSVEPIGRIIYTREKTLRNGEGDCATTAGFCHRASVFIADVEGAGERLLVPGQFSHLLAVSPDGSRVLVQIRDPDGDHIYLTDASGATLERFEFPCEVPCFEAYAFVFSPDGRRLAGVGGRTDETSVIAIMDMETGVVEELGSTVGIADRPGWSADGSRLAFGTYVVDADGGNLQQIAPASLFTGLSGEPVTGYSAPHWSPDGSLIAFASFNDTFPTNPPERNSQRLMDIYVVRPDGTDLRRLTTETEPPLGTNEAGDFGAAFPAWTRGGQITYTRFPIPPETEFELWVIDPDGTNAKRLDQADPAALTALGCVACTYPALEQLTIPNFAYWVPTP